MIEMDQLELLIQGIAGGFAIWTFGRLGMKVIELGAGALTQIPPALNALKEAFSGNTDAIKHINKTLEEHQEQKGKLTLAVNTQSEILAQNTVGVNKIATDLEGLGLNVASIIEGKTKLGSKVDQLLEDRDAIRENSAAAAAILIEVKAISGEIKGLAAKLDQFTNVITLSLVKSTEEPAKPEENKTGEAAA